ncbi:MAG: hypothetical protein EXR78_08765 [Deltaproteobacteria bacterium]|nr:hypothetical protein [Deltaproteobacteria bacterium]
MTVRKQPPHASLRVDTENEWVWCGEHRLKLTPKAFVVLCYLIEHAGRLVTKDQLMGAVWPDTVVSEWALTSCLREIRKALADTPKASQYIETVHRRGLRFIGPAASSQPLVVSSKEEARGWRLDTSPSSSQASSPRPKSQTSWVVRRNSRNFTNS